MAINSSSDAPDNVVKESGFDRVKRMYSKDVYGLLSPEMHYLISTTSTSVIITSAMGALIHMFKAREQYFRKNTASAFESQYLAKRNLSDTMTLHGMKGAATFALKYGAFSSLYLASIMTLANYNNKITVYEHIGSGAVIGATFRFNYGLKGMIAAGSAGGLLGLFAGSIIVAFMWYNDFTLEDLRKMQYESYYEMKKAKH